MLQKSLAPWRSQALSYPWTQVRERRGIDEVESLNDNNSNDDFYDRGEEDGHDEDTQSDEEIFDLSACIT